MTPDEIHVGQVLEGKGADADKVRHVLAIDGKHNVRTRVYRGSEDLGESTLHLNILARWAGRDITPGKEAQP